AAVALCSVALVASKLHARGQEKSEFPDGFDAMQVAPDSHKVVFENAFVRVLEVSVPPAGKSIPMHHHHWPSFFLRWETGGRTSHIRYHRGDGTVIEQPSKYVEPHPGSWSVHWMKPEAMHSIEVVESASEAQPNAPAELRIEIKCAQ